MMETKTFDLYVYRIEQLEQHVRALESKMTEEAIAKTKAERSQLLVGLTFLGATITTLGGIIWSYRFNIFGGSP